MIASSITPGCVPGIDYPPVEMEIASEYLHWPSDEERMRPKPESYYLYIAKQRAAAQAQNGNTQPLVPPARPPKLEASAFFKLLDEEMANAFMSLEQDRMVIARGHRDAIETIRRYVVYMQEQTGFLEYQIERHREFETWWKNQAELYKTVADRHAANIIKMAEVPAPVVDLTMPRLSLVDVEVLTDLAKKHTGSPQQPGTLGGLLEALYLPELDEFRTSYPVLHEAKAAIAKRVVDNGYAIRAYHIECRMGRRDRFLVVNFGFGEVNVFERDFKELFIRYPGPKDDWFIDGAEFDLDPAIEIIMLRDSRQYARLDSLFVVE